MGRFIYLVFFILMTSAWILTVKATGLKTLVHKNDVIITDDNGSLKCDQIICPKNSFLCHVHKETDPINPDIIKRTNTCYSKDGIMLFQAEKKTMAMDKSHTYFDLTADRDGLIIMNEEIDKGFHFSTQNISGLKGKKQNYIKGITNSIAEMRRTFNKFMLSHK